MNARTVQIALADAVLTGDLHTPDTSSGVVVFVHGSGSSRLSSRNRQVADSLNKAGLTTLLFDLLTEEEDTLRGSRFDIGLLSDRVAGATEWVRAECGLPMAYFGASTGAAAALAASLRHTSTVKAVVCRGGRPDLAGDALPAVSAPTLLIVGSLDTTVIDLNKQALQELRCEARMEIIEGATHLFEEPGKLEEVSILASQWFTSHLPGVC